MKTILGVGGQATDLRYPKRPVVPTPFVFLTKQDKLCPNFSFHKLSSKLVLKRRDGRGPIIENIIPQRFTLNEMNMIPYLVPLDMREGHKDLITPTPNYNKVQEAGGHPRSVLNQSKSERMRM